MRTADGADLLDAVTDAFFLTKAHPAPLRAQFVELFRAYAALSPEASGDVFALLFARLGRIPLGSDLEAFYEAFFVLKQIARGTDNVLAPHFDVLVEWMRAAIDLPAGLRGRISAGNVTSLLMTLAASVAVGDQRHAVAELTVIAWLRHRVDAPAALQRPSAPPPPSPTQPPLPLPRRSVPPPLPHRRPPSVSLPDDDDAPIPLSSRDLLPESLLMAIATPAFAFEPVKLPAPAAEAEAPAEPKPKRSRKSKKEGESNKRGARPRKR